MAKNHEKSTFSSLLSRIWLLSLSFENTAWTGSITRLNGMSILLMKVRQAPGTNTPLNSIANGSISLCYTSQITNTRRCQWWVKFATCNEEARLRDEWWNKLHDEVIFVSVSGIIARFIVSKMMLGLEWCGSYSEVRDELFLFLPPRFQSSAVYFPDVLRFKLHLVKVAWQEEQHNKSSPFHILFFHLWTCRWFICECGSVGADSVAFLTRKDQLLWVSTKHTLVWSFKEKTSALETIRQLLTIYFTDHTEFLQDELLLAVFVCKPLNVTVRLCPCALLTATNLLIHTVKIFLFYFIFLLPTLFARLFCWSFTIMWLFCTSKYISYSYSTSGVGSFCVCKCMCAHRCWHLCVCVCLLYTAVCQTVNIVPPLV